MYNSLAELLAGIAGIILSIIAEFVPAYQNLSTMVKRLVMAGLLILTAGLTYGLVCLGWINILLPNSTLTCDQPGLMVIISALIAALVANQATYTLFFKGRKPAKVK